MIISEGLSRLRALLNESSAGFYTDAQLYQYLDAAQFIEIEFLITKTYELRRQKKEFYRSNVLEGLVKLDTSNATTGSQREYSLPSDFLMTDYAEYSVPNTATRYPCRLDSFNDIMFNEKNTYLAATALQPAFYIRADKIGFSPVPSGGSANGYLHYYYKQPLTASSANGASAFSIGIAGHDAIVLIAYSLALKQDNRFQESALQLSEALKIIDSLP